MTIDIVMVLVDGYKLTTKLLVAVSLIISVVVEVRGEDSRMNKSKENPLFEILRFVKVI